MQIKATAWRHFSKAEDRGHEEKPACTAKTATANSVSESHPQHSPLYPCIVSERSQHRCRPQRTLSAYILKAFLEDTHGDFAHNGNMMTIITVIQSLGNAVCTRWGTRKGLSGNADPKASIANTYGFLRCLGVRKWSFVVIVA